MTTNKHAEAPHDVLHHPSYIIHSILKHAYCITNICTLSTAGVKRLTPSKHVAIATNIFLNNANDPSSHHTKFDIFLVSIVEVKKVLSVVQTYGEITHFQDFYKISSRPEKCQTWYGDYLGD